MTRLNPYPAGYRVPTSNFPIDLKGRAEWHESNRQRAITQVLLDLFLVAVKGYIKKGQTLSGVEKSIKVEGAEWQSWKSAEGNQAAHCIPRQLYIGAKTFDEFLEKDVPDRVVAMVFLFAETDDLPASFNRADSLAETKGLAEAFRRACVSVVNEAHLNGKFEANSAIVGVKAAYSLYKSLTQTSFGRAISHLEVALKQPGVDANAKKRREERIQILKHYQTALEESEGHAQAITLPLVEGLIRVYR